MIVMIFVVFLLLGATNNSEGENSFRETIEGPIERYIVTQSAISGFTGVLVGFTLWALGIDLAMVFGLFAFLLPLLGDTIEGVPLPDLLGLQLSGVDVERVGDYFSLFLDVTPAP